jgi:ESCRT-I complex subunit VPS37
MRLRHAIIAQDDQSESLASAFIHSSSEEAPSASASGKGIDEFVMEFKNLRRRYHKRVMWGERWGAGQVTWIE